MILSAKISMLTMIPDSHGFLETPSSNTGSFRQPSDARRPMPELSKPIGVESDMLQGHLDYLVLCGNVSSVSDLESALWAAFGVTFLWSEARPGTRGRFYESNVVSPTGVSLSTIANTRIGGVDYRLSVPGKVLSSVKEQTLRDFGRYLLSIDARCTRFDWAIDDYARQLDIDTIYAFCESGRVSGFGRCRLVRSLDVRRKTRGDCLYLGSVGSDKILRIYDKNVESNGEIDSIRVELQARDTIAHSYFADYFATPEIGDKIQRISMRAIGYYRFVEDVSEVLSRCPDVAWWAEFVRRVGGQIKVAVRRLAPMLSDKKRWVEKQVGGTLSLIFKCMGVVNGAEWLLETVQEKSREKEEYNQNYYDNWRERRRSDSENYDARVSRFVEEQEFRSVRKQLSASASEVRAVAPPILFTFRFALYLAQLCRVPRGNQLSLFPVICRLFEC